ncbi:MAG: sigma-70 family RNA polymerase sigma factor [Planctomycetes bacterium]|nr:sigma-70 family RNA polymerase sigma factor [Planctomycetota bacterium]
MRHKQARTGEAEGKRGTGAGATPMEAGAETRRAGTQSAHRRAAPRARRAQGSGSKSSGRGSATRAQAGSTAGSHGCSQPTAQVLTHAELDGRLDALATAPEFFSAGALTLAMELDRAGTCLEISDPLSWRRAPKTDKTAGRVTLAQQFRSEVDAMVILDREDEARLARRVEFARIRFQHGMAAAGLDKSAVVDGVSSSAGGFVGIYGTTCKLPGELCRRWAELHALRTEMVERNLYLVLINVERYSHTTASQGDLIQEGSAALFRAVDGFDWRRGLLFRTYAVHWLNQAFRSYLYNFTNTVRVPVYLQKALKHVNDAKNRLGDAKASVERIAQEAQLGEGLVAAAMSAARTARSIDMTFDDEGEGGRLKDLLEAEVAEDGPYTTALEDVSLEDSLGQALDRLSERERYVVSLRFGVGTEREHTLAEVAAKLGVSLERVRQIQVRAIGKLRNPQLRKVVDPYLN